MPLNLLDHCVFNGPALPEPFVRFELEKELGRLDLLSKTAGDEGKRLQLSWDVYRRKLRELDIRSGPLRVRYCVLDPLVERLGFARSESAPEVETREGREEGGFVLTSADGSTRLRTWTTEFDEDLDAPARRGAAYRFSHLRIAQRVLLAAGERIGLLTNGVQLRVLISDPARPDSEVVISNRVSLEAQPGRAGLLPLRSCVVPTETRHCGPGSRRQGQAATSPGHQGPSAPGPSGGGAFRSGGPRSSG